MCDNKKHSNLNKVEKLIVKLIKKKKKYRIFFGVSSIKINIHIISYDCFSEKVFFNNESD